MAVIPLQKTKQRIERATARLHGGARRGAGRPKGIATKPVRLPIEIADSVVALAKAGAFSVPFYASKVAAGIPAPADDHMEDSLNIFEYLVEDPPQTFFVRADGDSMVDAGISPNSILSVDRRFEPRHNHIVVAAIDGMLTVKRLYKRAGRTMLIAENDKKNYPPIVVTDDMNVTIWGVVRGAVSLFRL